MTVASLGNTMNKLGFLWSMGLNGVLLLKIPVWTVLNLLIFAFNFGQASASTCASG